MIIRLTVRQAQRVRQISIDQLTPSGKVPDLLAWWDRDQSKASKHRVDTLMPAAAWSLVEKVMFGHCFDERGFRAKERVRTTDLNALRTIRMALNVRENHPAMHQRGAIGLINEIIPAWKLPAPEPGDPMYSPYPFNPRRKFVVLAPESRTVNLKRVTLWVEAKREWEMPILLEESHLPFV